MKIRVRKVPPSAFLEGFDLRSYNFRDGHVYDVSPPLAKVLMSWEYAEPVIRRDKRDQAADNGRRK
jgi:hypothetical protein